MLSCINRNIVECKFSRYPVSFFAIWVLIETSWNVNRRFGMRPVCWFSINRNIVECKFNIVFTFFFNAHSINRNIVECKSFNLTKLQDEEYSINRNIVECKDCFDFLNSSFEVRINRNIVECKAPVLTGHILRLGTY